jgi:hypothetical protein
MIVFNFILNFLFSFNYFEKFIFIRIIINRNWFYDIFIFLMLIFQEILIVFIILLNNRISFFKLKYFWLQSRLLFFNYNFWHIFSDVTHITHYRFLNILFEKVTIFRSQVIKLFYWSHYKTMSWKRSNYNIYNLVNNHQISHMRSKSL